MKKYAVLLLLFTLAFSACQKLDDPGSQQVTVTEDDAIRSYLKAQNITTAVKDPSGLYYDITRKGTGNYPTSMSKVTVSYTGYLLNGTLVDRQNNFAADLNTSVIDGWKIGIPLVQTGGHINLYLPSALAYGSTSPGPNVPANSILIFSIDLISIN